MLNSLPGPIQLDIAIIATALAWRLGFFVADKRAHVFASLAIGCFVVLIGYSVASLGAPPWLVTAAPSVCDLVLLWYVMRTPRKMVVAYSSIWIIYIGFHVLLSTFLHYNYLIPPWHLHASVSNWITTG